MNLDDYKSFEEIDRQNMYSHIARIPDQLLAAWELGQDLELPDWKSIRQVLVVGMGESGMGAELLAAYAAQACSVPIIVHRDYGRPAWAKGPHTLVIASSYSGNTEETLSTFYAAQENKCQTLSITTGGELAQASKLSGQDALWLFKFKSNSHSAISYAFALPLAALARLNLLPDPSRDLNAAIQEMKTQQETLFAEVPVMQNPAKRAAGQMVGRTGLAIVIRS